jgi:hypothetical protein
MGDVDEIPDLPDQHRRLLIVGLVVATVTGFLVSKSHQRNGPLVSRPFRASFPQ